MSPLRQTRQLESMAQRLACALLHNVGKLAMSLPPKILPGVQHSEPGQKNMFNPVMTTIPPRYLTITTTGNDQHIILTRQSFCLQQDTLRTTMQT
eukprot:761924-Hanusia_phi.AAC.4